MVPPEFLKTYVEGFLPEHTQMKRKTENGKWGSVGEGLHRIIKRKAQRSGAKVVTTDEEMERLDRRVAKEDTCAQMLNGVLLSGMAKAWFNLQQRRSSLAVSWF